MVMKKIALTVLLVLSLVATIITVSALEPGYVYECAKLYYPVTVNGKIDGNEWDDAYELVVNADNPVFKEYGRWQGGNNPKSSSELSVTYKFKWDDENLYILEQRYDTNFIMYGGPDCGTTPWNGDGTLMFLAYKTNGEEYLWEDAYEPFWAVDENGNISFALRSWIEGSWIHHQEHMENWKGAGIYDEATKTLTVELVVPFADIGTVSGSKNPKVGDMLRFTPIISNIDTVDDYGLFAGSWDQLNFHDRYNRDDKVTVDPLGNDAPTEYPINWAGMKLVEAIVSEPEPAEEPTTNVPSPKTMDVALAFSFACLAVSSAVIAVKRKGR